MDIAVVIPAYNSGRYLVQCLDSVLSQTYPVSDVVVVDDGSDDQTAEVVRGYGSSVRYFWQPNQGASAARNRGVRQTSSPWIAFLDADDWWDRSKIEHQVAALHAHPDAVLSYTSTLVVDRDGRHTVHRVFQADQLWPALRYQNPIACSSVLMRRDRFEQLGGFDEKIGVSQDWDLWFRLGPLTKAAAVDLPLTRYRVVGNSLSRDFDRMLDDLAEMLRHTLLKDLTGLRREYWRRKAWSSELSRCAITAWEDRNPRALSLILRSLAVWPSPFFLPRRWKSLIVYWLRGSRTPSTASITTTSASVSTRTPPGQQRSSESIGKAEQQ